jgi:dienelactone hydrolase
MLNLKTSFMPFAMLSLWLLPALAHAEVKTREIEYKQGQTTLQGFLAWEDTVKGMRPGVLVVHEWWGLNDHAREQAKRLAAAGYLAFAIDMYGKGKLATHPNDAKAFVAEATASPATEKARFDAALAVLKKQPQVNPKQIGAVGYCFGGGVALDMARAGEPLAFVATFHGSLAAKEPAKKGAVKARLLILHGADDPMVDAKAVSAFKEEMTNAGAKYDIIEYQGAKHAFTNPDAGKFGVPGLEYNAKADQESFAALLKMLNDLFGPAKTAATTPVGAASPMSHETGEKHVEKTQKMAPPQTKPESSRPAVPPGVAEHDPKKKQD